MQTAATWRDLLYPGRATDFFTRTPLSPFNPNASGFDRDNARWLMELSRLIYRHDLEEESSPLQPTRTHLLEAHGLRQRKFFLSKESETQAMLVESVTSPSYAVLVFRGTEQNSGDIKTDLKIWKDFLTAIKNSIPLPNQNEPFIHEGFKNALEAVWSEIETELATLRCPLFYTGHSLGAALATLAAARRAPKAVYTFGSPRVGNRAFADSLRNVPIHRIVDGDDIVATLPPEELGFVPIGVELRVTTPQDPLLSRLKRLLALIPPKPLSDHAPISYLDRL